MTGCAVTTRTHRAYLELEARPGAVPEARRWTRSMLALWGLHSIADDTEVVVSELASNAVMATRALGPLPPGMQAAAPLLAVYLGLVQDRLYALVWDCSPEPPLRRPHDDDAAGGRGLEIVQALSRCWGFVADDQHTGKIVWAWLTPNRP